MLTWAMVYMAVKLGVGSGPLMFFMGCGDVAMIFFLACAVRGWPGSSNTAGQPRAVASRAEPAGSASSIGGGK